MAEQLAARVTGTEVRSGRTRTDTVAAGEGDVPAARG
jgi:hypothetical protein